MKGVARILIIYTVQTGDTLTDIADRYNVSRAKLIEANQLNYPDRLVVGQALVIPGSSADTHTGDIVTYCKSGHALLKDES